jgi:GH15 family glucan-1,4-alpha-glucosidase
MTYKPIRDYGIIGDMNSAALIAVDGSIDWCCFPRFDSPSVFAAILDDEKGGYWKIAPTGRYRSEQAYLPDTNVLTTTFTTENGRITVTDFMPLSESTRPGVVPHEIHRLVHCDDGEVAMRCLFQPRLNYARGRTRFSATAHGVVARRGGKTPESLTMDATIPMVVREDGASARFYLAAGETARFVLSYGRTRSAPPHAYHTHDKLRRTEAFWRYLVEEMKYDGLWKDQVVRSFLTLNLMEYGPSGAFIAAPTTSLPEEMGGGRNWDYRYSWLRDGAFLMDVLFRLGDHTDAHNYFQWLLNQCHTTKFPRALHGISPESSVKERILKHLEGYRGSPPVRIGNGAAGQQQLDVPGEVILSIATFQKYGGYISNESWQVVEWLAEEIMSTWKHTDNGLWEARTGKRHYVFSKMMCWVGLTRAIEIAQLSGRKAPIERWRSAARTIKEQVLAQGWSEKKQSFVQHYGSEALDASNLYMPMVGFLRPDDPRILATVERTEKELGNGCFLWRYRYEETPDGLVGQEGAFTMLTFWFISALLFAGQNEKAAGYFEEILSYASPLGLFSEMVDPSTGELLGNYPQAFSHTGLIHAARNLTLVQRHGYLPPHQAIPGLTRMIPNNMTPNNNR